MFQSTALYLRGEYIDTLYSVTLKFQIFISHLYLEKNEIVRQKQQQEEKKYNHCWVLR